MRNTLLANFCAVVATFASCPALAQDGPGAMGSGSGGMMGGMMACADGMGVMMLFPMLIMLLLVALLVLGIMSLVKYLRRG